MTYTDMELAKVLKVNRSTIFRWRTECSMPLDDLDAARAFAQNRKPATKRVPKVEVEPIPIPEGDENVYSVRDRLHKEERSIAAEVAGLNLALEQARSLNDEKSALVTRSTRVYSHLSSAAPGPPNVAEALALKFQTGP